MTIEGLGKKFQEARLARNLTLDEAARMTKIRPARLAEIEADDFSQFPSLAYAKGFLLIYGKFLDVDVTPYLDAFEDSERMTVDGYSYLQENRPQKPVAAPVVRRRRPATTTTTTHDRISPMPLIFGVLVLVIGFSVMKLILNVQRLAPGKAAVHSTGLTECVAGCKCQGRAIWDDRSIARHRCICSRALSAATSCHLTCCHSPATRNPEGFGCFRSAK